MRSSLMILVALCATIVCAEEPVTVAVIDGDPIFRVLEPGAIPAIDDPQFVTGEVADKQMKAEEPVLGIVVGGEAHAYSLWQLDAHEIVNDRVGGTAIAATW